MTNSVVVVQRRKLFRIPQIVYVVRNTKETPDYPLGDGQGLAQMLAVVYTIYNTCIVYCTCKIDANERNIRRQARYSPLENDRG